MGPRMSNRKVIIVVASILWLLLLTRELLNIPEQDVQQFGWPTAILGSAISAFGALLGLLLVVGIPLYFFYRFTNRKKSPKDEQTNDS